MATRHTWKVCLVFSRQKTPQRSPVISLEVRRLIGWLAVRHALNAGQCCSLGQPQVLDDYRRHAKTPFTHRRLQTRRAFILAWTIHGPFRLEVSIVVSSRTCSNEAMWFAMHQDAHKFFRWMLIHINPSHLPENWHTGLSLTDRLRSGRSYQ